MGREGKGREGKEEDGKSYPLSQSSLLRDSHHDFIGEVSCADFGRDTMNDSLSLLCRDWIL